LLTGTMTEDMSQYRHKKNRDDKISRERGLIATWLLSFGMIIFVLLVAVAVLLYIFGRNVPPGFMGLRQTYYGPTKGYAKEGYSPGLYLNVPFLSVVHLLPEGVRILNLEGDRSLAITTVEGAMVDLGVSIITRINRVPVNGDASIGYIGGPGDLAQSLTITDMDRWDKHIASVAEEALINSFSKLLASEFYIPEKRLQATENAIARIKPKLSRIGLILESLLIHNFDYERAEIESAIFAKNIQVKEKELNSALSRLAKVDAELEASEAKLKAELDVERTKGEQKALRIKSEASLNEAKNMAKGDELVALAKAQVKGDMAQLLTDQKGATRLIAEQMAPLLASLKGGVISGIDPYNLDNWAKRFGVEDSKANDKQ
jgi:hypothetical protein